MLNATSTHSSTASRPTHTFVVPVVREMPRPAAEPASFASCW
jgi:hypothetical protein